MFLDTDMDARKPSTAVGDCTKPPQTERRYHQGEAQGFCSGCALWVFEKDIAACPLGKRDLAVEAKADKEARRGGRPKKEQTHDV
jgi:hypothetical protein